jgi:Rrf2 family protein
VHLPISIEYAIHGLIFLANNAPEEITLLNDIAKAVRVPESYLRKVFQILAKRGIVISHRGVRGGYYLAENPADISVKNIIEAFEGSQPLYSCVTKGRQCSIGEKCPVKTVFETAVEKMNEILENKSIQDLSDEILQHREKFLWLEAHA